MNLTQLRDTTLDKTYGNPPPVLVPNSGTYQGECVSYVRQYCEAVLGIKTKAWGDAKDWWTNPQVLAIFDRVNDGSRKDGDILVWDDDPGTWTGIYGHIAISLNNQLLNQNYGGNKKVTINNFFMPGYLGALRLKGETMIDAPHQATLFVAYLGRLPTEGEVKRDVGKITTDTMINNLDQSSEYADKKKRDQQAYDALNGAKYVAVTEQLYRKA